MNQNLDNDLIFEIVRNQDYDKLLELTSFSKDLSFTNNEGNTLLHLACETISENTLSIVQYLLSKGCHPLSVNEKFKNCLDVAYQCKNSPAISLMRYYIIKSSY